MSAFDDRQQCTKRDDASRGDIIAASPLKRCEDEEKEILSQFSNKFAQLCEILSREIVPQYCTNSDDDDDGGSDSQADSTAKIPGNYQSFPESKRQKFIPLLERGISIIDVARFRAYNERDVVAILMLFEHRTDTRFRYQSHRVYRRRSDGVLGVETSDDTLRKIGLSPPPPRKLDGEFETTIASLIAARSNVDNNDRIDAKLAFLDSNIVAHLCSLDPGMASSSFPFEIVSIDEGIHFFPSNITKNNEYLMMTDINRDLRNSIIDANREVIEIFSLDA